jgi:hypothetical protein
VQLKTCQKEFKQMILQPELAQRFGEKWLHQFHGVPAEERLNVYRNNIFKTLTNVLGAVFPLCKKLVGEQTFKQLAYQYVHYKFPTQADLNTYGEEFPSYIETIPKIMKSVPYLSEIANYEWLYHTVLHAPYESVLNRNDLEMINKEKSPEFFLPVSTSFGFIHSSFPLKSMAEHVQENSNYLMSYEKGKYYFLIYRFEGEVIEEEISELFYLGLQFLKTKKSKSSRPRTLNELSNFLATQKQAQEVGPFIHFLFNRNLLKKV